MQDIFARAFAPKARLAYDGVRPYGAYVKRIAKNLMIDRARAVDPTIPLDDTSEVVALPPDDEDAAEWATQRAATVAYIATLSAELQRVVQLRFAHNDDAWIWYFPSSPDGRSVALPSDGGVLDLGIALGPEHAAGRYTVVGVFSDQPLDRAEVRARVERGEGVARSLEVQ